MSHLTGAILGAVSIRLAAKTGNLVLETFKSEIQKGFAMLGASARLLVCVLIIGIFTRFKVPCLSVIRTSKNGLPRNFKIVLILQHSAKVDKPHWFCSQPLVEVRPLDVIRYANTHLLSNCDILTRLERELPELIFRPIFRIAAFPIGFRGEELKCAIRNVGWRPTDIYHSESHFAVCRLSKFCNIEVRRPSISHNELRSILQKQGSSLDFPRLLHFVPLPFHESDALPHFCDRFPRCLRLEPDHTASYCSYNYERPIGPLNGCIPFWCFVLIVLCYGSGAFITIHYDGRTSRTVGLILTLSITPVWLLGRILCEKEHSQDRDTSYSHADKLYHKMRTDRYPAGRRW
jgi:hypothetical protein